MYVAVKGTVIMAEFQNDRVALGREPSHRMSDKKDERKLHQRAQSNFQTWWQTGTAQEFN